MQPLTPPPRPIRSHRSPTLALALALACASAPLLSAPEAPAAQPAKPGAKPAAPADPNLLRGPALKDGAAPPTAPGSSPFADPNEPGRRARARTQAEAFDRALAALSATDTPENLRLTREQWVVINEVRADWRAAEETFRRENMAELRNLRRERAPGMSDAPPKPDDEMNPAPNRRAPGRAPGAPGAPGGPGGPGANPGATDAERAALLERLRRLEDQRPDPAPFQARIWGALTDAQQERVRADIARFTDEMIERRTRQRLDELAPDSRPGAPGTPRAPGAAPPAPGRNPGAPAPGAPPDDARPRDQRSSRLAQTAADLGLTPDQLEQIRVALAAPLADAEQNLSFQERCARRLDALPASILPPDKKERVREHFFTHAPEAAERPKPR